MKIYLFVLMFLLSVSSLAAQAIPDPSPTQAADAKPKVTVYLKNGDRLTGTFISGDTKTIKMNFAATEISFKLDEVRSLLFGEDVINSMSRPSVISGIDGRVISGGVLNGKAVNLVKPAFPPAARAVGASGTVTVQITIDEEGKVISAAAVSGHPLLKQASEQAARESTFSPTILSGQKVKVTGIIVYSFSAPPPPAGIQPLS